MRYVNTRRASVTVRLGLCTLAQLSFADCSGPAADATRQGQHAAEPSLLKPAVVPAAADAQGLAHGAASLGELPRGKSPPASLEVAPHAAKPKVASAAHRVAHKSISSSAKSAAVPRRVASPKQKASVPSQVERKRSTSKPHVPTTASGPTAQVEAPAPAPTAVASKAPKVAAPKVTVTVPHTDHVHVDVPAGLQHWLDEDDRMRPWLGQAVSVIDRCYAQERADDPSAAGAISVVVTMHKNARPSGRVASAAPAVGGVVMCATTHLFGVKMPLFTGTEGDTYTVRVRFDP